MPPQSGKKVQQRPNPQQIQDFFMVKCEDAISFSKMLFLCYQNMMLRYLMIFHMLKLSKSCLLKKYSTKDAHLRALTGSVLNLNNKIYFVWVYRIK